MIYRRYIGYHLGPAEILIGIRIQPQSIALLLWRVIPSDMLPVVLIVRLDIRKLTKLEIIAVVFCIPEALIRGPEIRIYTIVIGVYTVGIVGHTVEKRIDTGDVLRERLIRFVIVLILCEVQYGIDRLLYAVKICVQLELFLLTGKLEQIARCLLPRVSDQLDAYDAYRKHADHDRKYYQCCYTASDRFHSL